MSDFISKWMEHNNIYESPSSFWKWASYATIAAALRDNCYLKQGERRLYPNIYVLSLAESSGHRKGPPIDLSETFINKFSITKVISGRTSVEAILDELARTETDKKTGRVIKPGSAIFYGAEMSAGIVANPDALKILTDIYDYKTNPYKSRLRTGPCFNLERIVFTMLSGSNVAMLKSLFGVAEVQGGFLARTFLITPNEERPPNSLLELDDDERVISLNLVLEQFSKVVELNGVFTVEKEAIKEYNEWYNPFKRAYQSKKEASGIVGRIHTGILKLAMILAANELHLNITKDNVERAINECVSLLPNYSIFTMGKGKAELQQAGGVLIAALSTTTSYTLSRKELIRKHFNDGLDSDMLEKLVANFEIAGMIRQIQTKEGLFIQLTDTCLNMMNVEVKQNAQL